MAGGPGGRAGGALLPHGRAGALRARRARGRAGHRVVAVDLAQELLDQFPGGHVLDLVHHPAPLPADPAVAHVEDLDRGFQLVLGERDDVAVGAVPQDHGLLFQRALERLDVVAQPGGPLEFLGPGGLAHLGFQAADEPVGLPGHEVAELLGQQPVLGLADPAHARGRAFADVAEQARPPDLAGPLEHPGRAGPDREHPQQRVDRFPDRPGVRVGPEITNPAPLGAAHHHDPREVLAHGHGQVGIALVVPVADVEPRVELLDPGVLQLERLDLGGHHGPVDLGRGAQHGLGPRVQAGEIREIGIQPLPEILRLSHVNDPAVRITEPVHTRRLGDGPGRWPVGVRICHPVTLFAVAHG